MARFVLVVLSALFAVSSAQLLARPYAAYGARPLAYAARPLAYAARPYAAYAAPVATVAHAPVAVAHAPVAAAAAVAPDYDPNPSYSFSYSVNDAITGDSKTQTESRNGDVVQGSYSVAEPDGSIRTVDYTADPINGFNADVHKDAPAAHAAPVAAVAHAPVIAARAAPLAYSAYGAPTAAIIHH